MINYILGLMLMPPFGFLIGYLQDRWAKDEEEDGVFKAIYRMEKRIELCLETRRFRLNLEADLENWGVAFLLTSVRYYSMIEIQMLCLSIRFSLNKEAGVK